MLRNKSLTTIGFLLLVLAGVAVFTACNLPMVKHKVTIIIHPKHIKSNQPFRLVYTFTSFRSDEPDIDAPETDDFTIIGRPNITKSRTTKNGKTETAYTYTYKLVPKHAGDCVVMPWAAEFDSTLVFVSDTFRIKVPDERITSTDSLAILSALYNTDMNEKMTSLLKPLTAQKGLPRLPGGVHFLHADSIYAAVANETISINYEMCFVNVQGFSQAEFANVGVGSLNGPTGVTVLTAKWGNQSSSTMYKNGTVSMSASRQYVVKLKAAHSGTYTLPALTFTYADKKYVAPAVKVVVK